MHIVILIWICREYSDYGALYQSQRDLLIVIEASNTQTLCVNNWNTGGIIELQFNWPPEKEYLEPIIRIPFWATHLDSW